MIPAFFLKKDGEKSLPNWPKILIVVIPPLFILGFFLWRGEQREEDSVLRGYVNHAVKASEKGKQEKVPVLGVSTWPSVQDDARPSRKKETPKQRHGVRINYSAPQVVERPQSAKATEGYLPIGTKAQAILRSRLDTRYTGQVVEAILPSGASFNGHKVWPAKTLLLGKMHYRGSGERIEINFNRGVTPDGLEFAISACALGGDAQGLTLGIVGQFHGNAKGRMARAVGLSAISNMAEVLTQKEALGKAAVISRKSSLSNAVLHAASEATGQEAKRQLETATDAPEYVTLEARTAFVVHLTESFRWGRNE